jgi:hypothetical protein
MITREAMFISTNVHLLMKEEKQLKERLSHATTRSHVLVHPAMKVGTWIVIVFKAILVKEVGFVMGQFLIYSRKSLNVVNHHSIHNTTREVVKEGEIHGRSS